MYIRSRKIQNIMNNSFLDTVSYIGKDGNTENRRKRLLSLIKEDFIIQKGNDIENIIIPSRQKTRLTLMAHYDVFPGSRGYNDNGSGVSVLLSLQDLVSDSVEIVFTDGEERMGLGSDYYFQNSDTEKAINVDVAGVGELVSFQRYSGFSDLLPVKYHNCLERFNVPFSDNTIASYYEIPNLLVFAGTGRDNYLDDIWSLQHGNENDNKLELLSENMMRRVSEFIRDTIT